MKKSTSKKVLCFTLSQEAHSPAMQFHRYSACVKVKRGIFRIIKKKIELREPHQSVLTRPRK